MSLLENRKGGDYLPHGGSVALELDTMSDYDSAKPFRLYSAPSSGVSEGQRGGMIHCTAHATLDEAKEALRHLEPGYSPSYITFGPDGKLVWPA